MLCSPLRTVLRKTDSTLSAVLCVRNLRRAKHRAAPGAVTLLSLSGALGSLGCGLDLAAKRCLADILNGRARCLLRASFYVEGTLVYA